MFSQTDMGVTSNINPVSRQYLSSDEVKKEQRHATNEKPNIYINIFNKKTNISIR